MREIINILHVEDDENDLLLMAEALHSSAEDQVYKIHHAKKLKQALDLIGKHHFDVILLDLGLPDVEGLDNVQAIIAENPEVPIIVLTGADNEHLAVRAIEYGAQEYLVKGRVDGDMLWFVISSSIHRKRTERALFSYAHYDELTGLINLSMFVEHLGKALHRASRYDRHAAILLLDVDNMKKTNEFLGRGAGDALLKEVAIRCEVALSSTDVIARYGDDEFVVLLDDQRGGAPHLAAAEVMTKLRRALAKRPVTYMGNAIDVAVTIGVAVAPEDGNDATSLLASAQSAMVQNRNAKRNKSFIPLFSRT
jgi:diguanylate cyclase (GGDEF)-like protein